MIGVAVISIFLLNTIEVAIIKTRDVVLDALIEEKNKKAIHIASVTTQKRHYQTYKQMIVVILTFTYVALITYYSLLSRSMMDDILLFISAFVFHVLILNHLSRRLALKYTTKISFAGIYIYLLYIRLFLPITILIYHASKVLAIVLNLNPELTDREMSEEEIRSILTESTEAGVINEHESEMIQSIFEFDDTDVSEVMTHRTDIEAIDIKMTDKEILTIIGKQNYSRYPVYQDSIDSIIGTLHLKDMLPFLLGNKKTLRLKSIMRKPYFIPETQRISDLLKQMKQTKNHIAIVIDEYGGTSGLVTFEDIIEELIGSVADEFDDDEIEIHQIDDTTYHILGNTNIYDVEETLQLGIDVDAYDTLSGFMLDQIGHLPEDNEDVIFMFKQVQFKALKITNHVFIKIEVQIKTESLTHE
jgi:putative hemolysin